MQEWDLPSESFRDVIPPNKEQEVEQHDGLPPDLTLLNQVIFRYSHSFLCLSCSVHKTLASVEAVVLYLNIRDSEDLVVVSYSDELKSVSNQPNF